ncbi:MAG: hypothetical protein RLZZ516_2088 [Cyanobacteriota bacterium]|jgi:FtsP/CotA-like multicopper oxidase with cupredoxin domain
MMAPSRVAAVAPRLRRSVHVLLPILAAAPWLVTPLLLPFAAEAAPRRVANPPLLQPAVDGPVQSAPRPGARPLLRAPGAAPQAAAQPASDEVRYDLDIIYADGEIYNPATKSYDKVRLRSYQGTGTSADTPFISPMIQATPGQTVRITLNNKLPAPDPSCANVTSINTPHCFNSTNLHAHGLWVSPAGNSDNVLVRINPGRSFQYEYNIPSDHPAGTFWYHTHVHGSTALQVSSGMAGALVIKGDRLPAPGSPGDLDTLLKPSAAQPFKERVVVLQQIPYACRDEKNAIKADANKNYICDAGDVAGVEGYDQLASTSWGSSGRYTSINGQVLPVFDQVRTGEIERWRVIHGGVRDTINLQFLKLSAAAPSVEGLKASANDAYVAVNCKGAPLMQHLVAADGLTLGKAIPSTKTVLQPGYRWDALMVFPEPGTYCIVDGDLPPSANVSGAPPSRSLLGFVEVANGSSVPQDLTAYVTRELEAAARRTMPANVLARVLADLSNNLGLQSFAPHADIEDSKDLGSQSLAFNIAFPGGGPPLFQIDGQSFNPADEKQVRVLRLGGADEWTLTSKFASHPFHIHVNPFQVVKITDASNRDVSAPDAVDGDGQAFDPEYRGLKGVWKDTLMVKQGYEVVVRSRYRRYIGEFVLHCHILDHEDQGMMQKVRIDLPDAVPSASNPGVGAGHAHH